MDHPGYTHHATVHLLSSPTMGPNPASGIDAERGRQTNAAHCLFPNRKADKPTSSTCPRTGHNVVLGTAGSGKTLIAILRAAHLANPALPEHGPTLLVTFKQRPWSPTCGT